MYKSEIYFIRKRKQPWPEVIKEQIIVICTSLDFFIDEPQYMLYMILYQNIVLRMLNLQQPISI